MASKRFEQIRTFLAPALKLIAASKFCLIAATMSVVAQQGTPAPEPYWQGLYLGGYVSFDDFALGKWSNAGAGAGTIKDDGISGGLLIGIAGPIDEQKKIMAGVEVDVFWPGLMDIALGKDSHFRFDDEVPTLVTQTVRSSVDYCTSLAVHFRLGREVSENTVIYGSAGPSYLCLDLTSTTLGSSTSKKTVHLLGAQFGGGIEHWFNEIAAVRGEVLYSLYENQTGNLGTAHTFKLNPDGYSLRAILVVKLPVFK